MTRLVWNHDKDSVITTIGISKERFEQIQDLVLDAYKTISMETKVWEQLDLIFPDENEFIVALITLGRLEGKLRMLEQISIAKNLMNLLGESK